VTVLVFLLVLCHCYLIYVNNPLPRSLVLRNRLFSRHYGSFLCAYIWYYAHSLDHILDTMSIPVSSLLTISLLLTTQFAANHSVRC
jgi:hypothetical protein